MLELPKNEIYKPRQGKVGANMHMYSDDQLKFIDKHCNKMLKKFGYSLTNEEE